MNKIWIGIACLLFSLQAGAQKTPDELAEYMFKAMRAQNIKAVCTYLATPEEVLLYSKRMGNSYTKDQAEDFKTAQVALDSAFTSQCQFVLDDGKQKGIQWGKAQFVKAKNEVETYILSSKDEEKTIDFGPVSAIFSYEGKQYILTFETAIEATGRWRLTGDKVKLRTYTE